MPNSPQLPHCITSQTVTSSDRPHLKYWLKGPGHVTPNLPQLPHCITSQTVTSSDRPNLKYWLKGPGQVMPNSPQLPHCITSQTVTSSDRPNLKYWFKTPGQVMLTHHDSTSSYCILYPSGVLSAIDYGLGFTTMAQTNLLNLDRVQNEAMQFILGNTKDTPTETMRFMLDLSAVQTR